MFTPHVSRELQKGLDGITGLIQVSHTFSEAEVNCLPLDVQNQILTSKFTRSLGRELLKLTSREGKITPKGDLIATVSLRVLLE